MKLAFTKMQGCGNDYVYINGFQEVIDQKKKPDVVRFLSERHFGIGGDGVIFINPSEIADFEMEMYNADGSRAEMCGNGIRCVARYVYDHKMTEKESFTIESFGKIKYIDIIKENGEVALVRVDMGEPILEAELVPVISDQKQVIAQPITIGGKEFAMTCVSMGNPHCVVFTDTKDVEQYGALFEKNEAFPKYINTEFVDVIDRQNVNMRVYERGTGETLACGTGCCATVTACVLNGKTDREITVHVLGGDIKVFWNEEDNHIYMSGPAKVSFTGEIEI